MRCASIAAVVALAGVAGCSLGGSSDDDSGAQAPARPALKGAQAHAGAPPTAGTLTQIADSPAAQRRLAYIAVEALGQADLPFSGYDVTARVLGRGAAVLGALPDGAARSAVQVGADATVLRGTGLESVEGLPSGDDGVVVGAQGAAADALADPRPTTSAITPGAQSAVQSCLGDTLAQTVLGPATMGNDAAVGVGLAESGDPPAGIQLRICGAPRLIRDLHGMEKRLKRQFGRGAIVEEREIGEREIVAGIFGAADLPPRQVLRLLAGGRELRALAWR